MEKQTKYLNILIFLCIFSVFSKISQAQEFKDNLIDLSLEQLMEIEVTTASKMEEKMFDTPAAVYVITAEDIRRSGVRSIPDALRIVPGVDVAQINSNEWAVSIRGFNDSFANKLLVLVDGRNVYTPMFGGVVWSDLDTLISEIERIEVIRGPGGAVWGNNAVNGVINIITKNSKDTKGNFVEGGGGNEQRGFVNLRHGGDVSDIGTYKIFANYFNRDSLKSTTGGSNNDNWQSGRVGLRFDLDPTEKDELMITANFFTTDFNRNITIATTTPDIFETFKSESDNYGFDMQALWRRQLGGDSYIDFQIYYEYINRDLEGITKIKRNTIDMEMLHRIPFSYHGAHDLIWGLNYRFYSDDVDSSEVFSLNDPKANINLISGFIQDQVSFFNNKLIVTLGSKFEHNDFTGFEVQPNFRVLVSPDEKNRFWASVSKAVRVPARIDDSVRFLVSTVSDPVTGQPVENQIFGNTDLLSETVWAFELGYRTTPYEWVNLDIASYINLYKNLNVAVAQSPMFNPGDPSIILPFEFENDQNGKTYGIEVASTFTPYNFWKLRLNYTFFNIDLDLQTSDPAIIRFPEGTSPKHKFAIQSFLNLPHNFEFDSTLYWVDELDEFDIGDYTRLDIRLGYTPIKNLSFSIVGQNLLKKEHQEFGNSFIGDSAEIERSFIGSVRWDFK